MYKKIIYLINLEVNKNVYLLEIPKKSINFFKKLDFLKNI